MRSAERLIGLVEEKPQEDTGSAPEPDLVAIVDQWFAASFPNTVVSRDVHIWTVVFEAVQDLKKRLSRG